MVARREGVGFGRLLGYWRGSCVSCGSLQRTVSSIEGKGTRINRRELPPPPTSYSISAGHDDITVPACLSSKFRRGRWSRPIRRCESEPGCGRERLSRPPFECGLRPVGARPPPRRRLGVPWTPLPRLADGRQDSGAGVGLQALWHMPPDDGCQHCTSHRHAQLPPKRSSADRRPGSGASRPMRRRLSDIAKRLHEHRAHRTSTKSWAR
ncbi:hypothetical protein C8Q77DRAFT_158905 [Trametes polyzona]|nr:hypothetical protein C8Q77DRAFT_158905 [Trametes polyzona]